MAAVNGRRSIKSNFLFANVNNIQSLITKDLTIKLDNDVKCGEILQPP